MPATAMRDSVAAFQAKLRAHDRFTRTQLDQVSRTMAFTIAENIIVGGPYGPGTPVDTGFCRANWTVSVNAENEGTLVERPKNVKRVPFDAMQILLALAKVQAGDIITLANNTVYADSLEHGHSRQAPAGMVRIVIAAGQTIADDTVRQLGLGTPRGASA